MPQQQPSGGPQGAGGAAPAAASARTSDGGGASALAASMMMGTPQAGGIAAALAGLTQSQLNSLAGLLNQCERGRVGWWPWDARWRRSLHSNTSSRPCFHLSGAMAQTI
jgi:hypothetical protein